MLWDNGVVLTSNKDLAGFSEWPLRNPYVRLDKPLIWFSSILFLDLILCLVCHAGLWIYNIKFMITKSFTSRFYWHLVVTVSSLHRDRRIHLQCVLWTQVENRLVMLHLPDQHITVWKPSGMKCHSNSSKTVSERALVYQRKLTLDIFIKKKSGAKKNPQRNSSYSFYRSLKLRESYIHSYSRERFSEHWRSPFPAIGNGFKLGNLWLAK